MKKNLMIDGNSVSVQIWDLGGQDSFQSLRKLYIEGAQGALAVFDVTSSVSFEKLNQWVKDFKAQRPNAPILLIGNKIDLSDSRAVSEEEAISYAKENEWNCYLQAQRPDTKSKTHFNA